MTTIQRSATPSPLSDGTRRAIFETGSRTAVRGVFPGGSSLDLDAGVVVLDLQELARQRLS